MILNQAEFSEVKPWLDLLSAEMGTDFAAEWKLQKLPRNSEQPEEMPLPVLLQLSLQWEPVKQVRKVLMNI